MSGLKKTVSFERGKTICLLLLTVFYLTQASNKLTILFDFKKQYNTLKFLGALTFVSTFEQCFWGQADSFAKCSFNSL